MRYLLMLPLLRLGIFSPFAAESYESRAFGPTAARRD